MAVNDVVTEQEAETLLVKDMQRAASAVNSAVRVQLNENEFSALVSLAFNIGNRAFRDSTLLRNLNAGDRTEAGEQFLRWNKVNGKIFMGLVHRRVAELELFLAVNA